MTFPSTDAPSTDAPSTNPPGTNTPGTNGSSTNAEPATDRSSGGAVDEPTVDRSRGRAREPGFVAVEWIAAMVFLLIPVVMIGAGVSRWPERQQVARASAAEAARAAVLSDTQAAALAEADRVAGEVAANYGVPADQFTVRVDAPAWDWGEEVTVTVTMSMPALDIPGAGSWAPTDWSASSTQRIEDYRGLQG